mgnify:CR=1 FL=1
MEKRAESLTLEEQLKKLEHENETLKALVRWYEGQFRLAQRQRFGSSSEKTHPDQPALPARRSFCTSTSRHRQANIRNAS